MKNKFLSLFIISALITSCSNHTSSGTIKDGINQISINLTQSDTSVSESKAQNTFLSKKDLSALDKEYGQFNTKALTKSYLYNKLKKLEDNAGVNGDGTGGIKLVRDIEFARLRNPALFCTVMSENSDIKGYIDSMGNAAHAGSAIYLRKSADTPFKDFLNTGCSSGSIVTSGLVLNLDAGNTASYLGSGITWSDLSGNGNNATLINGPAFDSANQGSIVLDGTNYVNVPNGYTNIFKNKSTWTASIWFKVNSWGTGNQFVPVLFSIGSGLTPYYEFFLEIALNTYYFSYVNSLINGTITTNFNLGQIYNLIYMKDGNTLKVYKNSSLIGSHSSQTAISTVDGDLWLGRFKNAGYELNGNIYNTQIYNRALTSEEVLQNYNAVKSRFGL